MSDPSDGGPWSQRSEELARWALARLANRTDRCGGYFVNDDDETRPTTRPYKGPQCGYVSHALLTKHFRANGTDQIVGLHSLNEQSFGKWVALDVDAHPGRDADPRANEAFSLAAYAELAALGFDPLLYESNGRGGYHLVVLFARPVAGRVLLHLGRWLTRSHAAHGLPDQPEVFPKQECLDASKAWGSWLRVVGRHHTRDFWPRVWTGGEWASGAAAVGHVLSLAGDEDSLVPFEVLAASGAGTPEEDPVGEKGRAAWELTPGDDFNQRDEWPAILEPHGWKLDRREGDREHWTRPGKRGGTSATLGFCKGDSFRKLYVFSSGAAPLQERETYSPFGAYFVLNHGGDARRAYRELADRGYGRRAPEPARKGAARQKEAASTPRPVPPTPPTGTVAGGQRTGAQIILDYFLERYRPVFRRKNSVYGADGEITKGVACDVPTSVLIEQLKLASDAPRFAGAVPGPEAVKVHALPAFFRTWASVAWGDLLSMLPDEDSADLGGTELAREEFRRLVRDAMLTEVQLGDNRDDTKKIQVERRSLIEWCEKFAKPGPWRSIRSKRCWCKVEDLPGSEIRLKVAIRQELFAQLRADRRLCDMAQNTFARRAKRYGVGSSNRADRPEGGAAVVLDDDFVAELTASLSDPIRDEEIEREGIADFGGG